MIIQSLSNQSLSSLMGWISFASWLLVYTPQIYENYLLQSGEGVSIYFVLTWMIGDLTNLFGAVKQHLLKTMIFLSVYYTICDMVLLFQIFYYRQRRHRHQPPVLQQQGLCNSACNNSRSRTGISATESSAGSPDETSALLPPSDDRSTTTRHPHNTDLRLPSRRPYQRFSNRIRLGLNYCSKGLASYITVYCLIVLIGTCGWLISERTSRSADHQLPVSSSIHHHEHQQQPNEESWNTTAQIMGWISAAAYLGSRIPQIYKNQITKCNGLSLLFIVVGITANLTYCASILIADQTPLHIFINLSWLVGSAGTIFLDLIVLYQFWIYRHECNPPILLQADLDHP